MAALSPVRIDWSRAIEASYVPAKIVNGFNGPEFVDDEITDGDDAVPRAVMQNFLDELAQEVAGRTWTKEDGGEGVTVIVSFGPPFKKNVRLLDDCITFASMGEMFAKNVKPQHKFEEHIRTRTYEM